MPRLSASEAAVRSALLVFLACDSEEEKIQVDAKLLALYTTYKSVYSVVKLATDAPKGIPSVLERMLENMTEREETIIRKVWSWRNPRSERTLALVNLSFHLGIMREVLTRRGIHVD